MTGEEAKKFVEELVDKHPGLVYPNRLPVRPGALIGFLQEKLQDPYLISIATKHLPKPKEH